jgi:hypothetical protein
MRNRKSLEGPEAGVNDIPSYRGDRFVAQSVLVEGKEACRTRDPNPKICHLTWWRDALRLRLTQTKLVMISGLTAVDAEGFI